MKHYISSTTDEISPKKGQKKILPGDICQEELDQRDTNRLYGSASLAVRRMGRVRSATIEVLTQTVAVERVIQSADYE